MAFCRLSVDQDVRRVRGNKNEGKGRSGFLTISNLSLRPKLIQLDGITSTKFKCQKHLANLNYRFEYRPLAPRYNAAPSGGQNNNGF